jgi:hypothetical protein
VFVGFSRIFLLGILIFKRLTARRLYKWFGVKGLIPGTGTETGLKTGQYGARNSAAVTLPKIWNSAVGSKNAPIQWGPKVLYSRLMQPRREDDHSAMPRLK